MLGWCPRPPLQHRTSSRSCLAHQTHEIVHFSPALDDEKPVLQPSHQIVIGFDLGTESGKSLLTQGCESPRSVLEPHHLHRPQAGSPRSAISALGSLLAERTRVGKSIKANPIKAEEFTSDVHTYHPELKSDHVACGGGVRVHAYNASDSVAPPIHGRVKASQNQLREGQSHVREGCLDSRSCDDEDDFSDDPDVDMVKSIFSAASPLSNYHTFRDQSTDFLSKCFRCSRRLGQGKDIYMYRGDQAFCSQECRYKQIVADERKDRSAVVAPCFRVTGGHRSVARAFQAALA